MPLRSVHFLQDENQRNLHPPESNNYKFTSNSACDYYNLGEAKAKEGKTCRVPFLYFDFIQNLESDLNALTCSGHKIAYAQDAAKWFAVGMESILGLSEGFDDKRFIDENEKFFYGASFCYTGANDRVYIDPLTLIALFRAGLCCRDSLSKELDVSSYIVDAMFDAIRNGYDDVGGMHTLML